MNTLRRTANAVLDTSDLWPSAIGLFAAGVALSGGVYLATHPTGVDGDGHGKDSARYISSLSDAKRVEHDFANWSAEAGDDCLEGRGYDPFDYTKYGDARKVHNVGKVSFKDGVIIIEPGQPDEHKHPLELLPNDGSEPLQGATPESRQLLTDFHCQMTY